MDLQPRNVADLEKLTDCKAFIQLMKSALERADWPKACDKVAKDNYPREEIGEVDRAGLANLKVTTTTINTPNPDALATAVPSPASTGISRVSKRGREEDDGQLSPRKHSRVKTV